MRASAPSLHRSRGPSLSEISYTCIEIPRNLQKSLDLEVSVTFCYVKISCEKNENSICEKAFVRKSGSLLA